MDEDKANMAIRKFLKQVGVTSQREIEALLRASGGKPVRVKMVLTAEGTDLRADLPISLDLAVLGGKARFMTPDGNVELKIAPGKKATSTLRLRGRGLHKEKGGRGDIYVTPRIALPEKDDATLQSLMREWRHSKVGE